MSHDLGGRATTLLAMCWRDQRRHRGCEEIALGLQPRHVPHNANSSDRERPEFTLTITPFSHSDVSFDLVLRRDFAPLAATKNKALNGALTWSRR